ncbi:MAG: hypothetical protein ABIC40_00710, partial [bacterium]
MPNRFCFIASIFLLSIFLSACSNAGDPISQDFSGKLSGSNSTVKSSNQLWGYWNVSIDPQNFTAEITPIRTAEFTANVTVFLQPPLGKTSNLGIKVTDTSEFLTEGLIDVEVALHHPFPGLDMYTGFDVMGVFIHNGAKPGTYDPDVFWPDGNGTALLLNADGYTRWYNPVEFPMKNMLGFVEGALGTKNAGFNATVNPYRYFCDSLGKEDDVADFFHEPSNIENRGLFSPTTNTRLYKLQFPMVGGKPELKFQYAVIASWLPPEGDPPYEVPDDFPLSANRAEAFHIKTWDDGSTLWYKTGIGAGGIIKIKAEIFDWGALANPDGVKGEVGQVILESTDLDIPGGFLAMTPDELFVASEPGTDVSSVVSIELDGCMPLHSGEATFLMTIESANPSSYEQGFGVGVPDDTLASYFIFTLPIAEDNPCTPPSVALDAPDSGIASKEIEFDASGTTGTPPITFDWDWDGDGTYDESTSTGLVTHIFSPGVFLVGLRVSNACGEDILDPAHEITITCPDEVYDNYLYNITCLGSFTSLRQDGTAFLPNGKYLVKAGDQLIAYDVTSEGDKPGDVLIADMANAGMTGGGSYHFLANLDYDEVLDRLVYSTLYGDNERVTVYESDGTYVTDFVIPGTDGVIAGIDTDGDGSIWCLYHTPGGSTGTNSLTHWEWNSGTGEYDQVTADTFDCTFIAGGARGNYDIAIIPEVERLYVLHMDAYPWQGAVYAIDISASPPTHLSSITKNQIFSWGSNDHAASISDFNKWEGSSIEVDHGDGSAETCRLIVQMSFQTNGNGIGFMKFDSDLNELDHYRVSGQRLLSAAIRPGTDIEDRLLVMPTWTTGS